MHIIYLNFQFFAHGHTLLFSQTNEWTFFNQSQFDIVDVYMAFWYIDWYWRVVFHAKMMVFSDYLLWRKKVIWFIKWFQSWHEMEKKMWKWRANNYVCTWKYLKHAFSKALQTIPTTTIETTQISYLNTPHAVFGTKNFAVLPNNGHLLKKRLLCVNKILLWHGTFSREKLLIPFKSIRFNSIHCDANEIPLKIVLNGNENDDVENIYMEHHPNRFQRISESNEHA